MVTYLIKEAPARAQMFTREAMQLEAYCSAIGKVLLARLPEADREAYLRQDGFVALTSCTIVAPDALRLHLAEVAAQGFALDAEEIATGLYCIAVPVAGLDGLPAMAISVAGPPPRAEDHPGILQLLCLAATTLAARLGAKADWSPADGRRL
jgi:IclR family acetate operon transcriptional repressor